MRTFTLLGGLAGVCGWLWASGSAALSAVILAGAAGLVVAAYFAAAPRDPDGTTEVAALVTIAAGVVAGVGHLALSSAVIAVTALLLIEKSRVRHRREARRDGRPGRHPLRRDGGRADAAAAGRAIPSAA